MIFGVAAFALIGWWLARSIEHALRNRQYVDRFALVSLWPFLGRLPLGNVRFMLRYRWLLLASATAVGALVGMSFATGGGPVELRMYGVAMALLLPLVLGFWVWIINAGVRRGGGLPPPRLV